MNRHRLPAAIAAAGIAAASALLGSTPAAAHDTDAAPAKHTHATLHQLNASDVSGTAAVSRIACSSPGRSCWLPAGIASV